MYRWLIPSLAQPYAGTAVRAAVAMLSAGHLAGFYRFLLSRCRDSAIGYWANAIHFEVFSESCHRDGKLQGLAITGTYMVVR